MCLQISPVNATNQSVAAIDSPSQTRIDGNSIALVCYQGIYD
jgi:hypothetical protein